MTKELDVGMKCIKYMIFVANFMFVMIGFLLVSIGATIKAIYGDFEMFMETHYFSPAILAIAIGIIIFFVAIFGCIGAIKESTFLINLFAVFLALVLVLEIAAAVAAYAMRGDIEGAIRKNMNTAMESYYLEHNRYERDAWDFTQERLHCCGVDSSGDWLKYLTTSPPTEDGENLWEGPKTCCRHDDRQHRDHDDDDDDDDDHDDHDRNESCTRDNIWKSGCLDSLSYIISECALLLGCGALAVAFIQVLGIAFAIMLGKAIRRLKTQSLVEREQHRQKLYEQLARGTDDKPTPVLYSTVDSSDA